LPVDSGRLSVVQEAKLWNFSTGERYIFAFDAVLGGAFGSRGEVRARLRLVLRVRLVGWGISLLLGGIGVDGRLPELSLKIATILGRSEARLRHSLTLTDIKVSVVKLSVYGLLRS